MKQNVRRMIAAVLCGAMAVSAAPLTVSAAGGKHIVVIGDTLSTNAGLVDGELSYVELLEGYCGTEADDFTQEGYTTAEILASLDRADVQAALADADVILVSAGMHDVMDAYIEKANEYRVQYGFERFTDLFTTSKADVDVSTQKLIQISTVLGGLPGTNQESAQANILAIGEKLSAYQDTADIIYLNVYNLMNTIENYDSLSALRKTGYDSISDPIDTVLTDYVNAAYSELAQTYKCDVIDTFSMFAGQSYVYSYPEKVEPRMNPAGHEKVAFAVADAIDLLQTGDVNGDGEIDASDAASILSHAAAVGAGGAGIFNALQLKAAQTTVGDTDVDAADAASILMYAAIKGAGGNPSFDTLTS